MRKLLSAVLLLCASVCFGQGATIPFQPAVTQQGNFLSFATITFCSIPTTINTLGVCQTPVTVFKDQAMALPYSSAIQTDGIGYFPPNAVTATSLWFAPGTYCYTLTVSSMTSPATNPCTPFTISFTASSGSLTVPGSITQTQPTAATNVANQSSFLDCMNASYWTGSISATDQWCFQDALGTGSNPTSTFTLTHGGSPGSSGAATFSVVPNTSFTGNVTIKGGTPWIDITAYGAKCDNGTTDNTTPIQNAWNAAKALGSNPFVFIPPCNGDFIYSSTLNFSSSNGIRFGSLGGGNIISGSPRLVYTGAASPAINCQFPIGLTFQNFTLLYNNAAFTGTVMDCSSTGVSTGANLKLDNVNITGTSTAKLATNLLLVSWCMKCGVYYATFNYGVNGITADSANVFTVEDSDFASFGPFTGAYLLNIMAGSRMTGNNFEMFNAPNSSSVFDSSSAGCFGCLFVGNWIGDMPVGYTGTLIKATGGMNFSGNTFQGQAAATLMSINGGQDGLTFTGNATQQAFSVVFSSNAPVTGVNITGNKWAGALGTFYAGSLPSTGLVTDNTGLTKNYGNQSVVGTSTVSGQIFGPAGVVGGPSFSFAGDTNTGMWDVASDHSIRLSSNGVLVNEFVQGQTRFGSTGTAGFTSTTDPSASSMDTGISRLGAALIGIGNGTNGDFSGGIQEKLHRFAETTAPGALATVDICYGDSTAHKLECAYNNAAFFPVTQTIGSSTVTTAGTAVTNGTCQAQTGITITGSLTTDQAVANINAALPATWQTGIRWSAEISAAGTCTVNLCNPTAGSITPAATSVRCTVTR